MQKIDKVIIYRENDLIYSFAYSKEKLYFTVLDKVDGLYSESILPIKITKLNKANHSAFLEYGNKQTGYINLPKWLKTQDGSKLHAQLTWSGDDTKQAKFRAGWQLIGKYIVYNSKSTELTFTNKNITQEIFTKLTATLQSLPANWSIRSSVNNKTDLELIFDEAKEIYHIAKQIETNHAECYLGIANYLKIFRELSISDDLEVTTNCQNIHAELIKKQDLWLIDAISYKKTLILPIDRSEVNQPCVTLENGSMLDIGSYAGINIIDINSGSNNTNKQTTNFLILDEVYRQICIRNLQGIILVDVIKDSSLLHNEKIISYLQKLFRQDISQTKILGFSNSGLLEIIRNKF